MDEGGIKETLLSEFLKGPVRARLDELGDGRRSSPEELVCKEGGLKQKAGRAQRIEQSLVTRTRGWRVGEKLGLNVYMCLIKHLLCYLR